MVKVVKHDLQFIQDQIKIAEAHSAGTPLTKLLNRPLNPNTPVELTAAREAVDTAHEALDLVIAAKAVTYQPMEDGLGNDFIRRLAGLSFLMGDEGDYWIEGGDSFGTLAGENSELFFNPTIKGHDLRNGLGNDNDYDAESGDGIIFQGSGIQLTNEMAGFDWAIHNWDSQAADSEMSGSIFTNQQINILRDRFDLVEGLSGWKLNDKLTGRDVVIGGYDHRPI